jgi:hypothetical protein
MNEVAQAAGTGLLKRIEALLALIRGRLAQGAAAFLAASNYTELTNIAVIGPAPSVTFSAPLTTKVSGHVKVTASGSVLTSSAGDPYTYQLIRDGAVVFGPVPQANSGTTVDGGFALEYNDTSQGPGLHTWGVIVTAVTAGHTVEFTIGTVGVTIQELPT